MGAIKGGPGMRPGSALRAAIEEPPRPSDRPIAQMKRAPAASRRAAG